MMYSAREPVDDRPPLPSPFTGKPIHSDTLTFDASFDSGNLGAVTALNSNEFELEVQGDSNNDNYRVWFNFNVSTTEANKRVVFYFVNFSKSKSLYRLGMSPMVRSSSRPAWERVPSRHVFYYQEPKRRRQYVLAFAFCFDRASDVYSFAYAYPYSFTEYHRLRHLALMPRFSFLDIRPLCVTDQGREVDIWRITSSLRNAQPNTTGSKGAPGAKKRLIVVSARVHPGETSASFVMHGVIAFLLSDHPAAMLLRRLADIYLIPMLNPDGVFLGNYRSSSLGYDLNRQWLSPSVWAHTPIYATRKFLTDYLDQHPTLESAHYIDLHGHTTLPNCFMYVNGSPSAMELPSALAGLERSFCMASTRYCRDQTKLSTGRRTLTEVIRAPLQCYTFETSMYGYREDMKPPMSTGAPGGVGGGTSSTSTPVTVSGANSPYTSASPASGASPADGVKIAPYTTTHYAEIGRNLILALLDVIKADASMGWGGGTAPPPTTIEERTPAGSSPPEGRPRGLVGRSGAGSVQRSTKGADGAAEKGKYTRNEQSSNTARSPQPSPSVVLTDTEQQRNGSAGAGPLAVHGIQPPASGGGTSRPRNSAGS